MNEYNRKVKRQLRKLKPEIESWLKQTVSEHRFNHIENVAKTARRYAKKLGLDHYKAELSGWLHDCAKEFPNEKLLEIARANNLPLDEIDLENPHILHARVSAIVAGEKFGIDDPDVLGGIRCHTLAEPEMTEIMMVIYLADATEPARDRRFAAPVRRILKNEGLTNAVLKTMDKKLTSLIQKGSKIHPLTIRARNWLLYATKQ